MKTLQLLLLLGGLLHFAILSASALVPRVLRWGDDLSTLPSFLRRLFWVYGGFIVLVIVGFGALTLANAGAMAAGEPVARGLCAFIAAFWLVRLAVQCFVFDPAPYLTNGFLKLGYHSLTLAFIYLTLVYGAAATLPGGWR